MWFVFQFFNPTYSYTCPTKTNMLRIRTDDLLFIVSKKTIENKCPKSVLLNTEVSNDGLIIAVETEQKTFDVTTLYLNVDPVIMKQLIRLLRGGKIEKTFDDHNFLNTVAENLNMSEIIGDSSYAQKSLYEQKISHNYSNTNNIEDTIREQPLNLTEFDPNSEFQNNIAKIFGVSKPQEISDADSFALFSSNLIESINESIGTNNIQNEATTHESSSKKHKHHKDHKDHKHTKKSKSKILLLDTAKEDDVNEQCT